MKKSKRLSTVALVAMAICGTAFGGTPEGLPLSAAEAVQDALEAEPGITASELSARAAAEMSAAERALPDPQLSVGVLNLPDDTFDLHQEPMTQLRIGVKQAFPRGDTRAIRSTLAGLDGEMAKVRAESRKRDVQRDVTLLWLDLRYWLDTRATVQRNREFFTDLVQITRSLYSVGQRDQQDLIHSQLQVSRLDDQIAMLTENERRGRNQLARWIGVDASLRPLAAELPFASPAVPVEVADWTVRHPMIREVDLKIESGTRGVELARQEYKPGWSLDLAYSNRQDDPMGNARADFLSATVMLDLPLFTAGRQDRRVRSMEYRAESLRSTRIEMLRRLTSDLEARIGDHEETLRRIALFERELLPRVEQRSDAALNAYQSNAADFSDVMGAYIERLNTTIEYRKLQIGDQKLRTQIEYYRPDAAPAEDGIR